MKKPLLVSVIFIKWPNLQYQKHSSKTSTYYFTQFSKWYENNFVKSNYFLIIITKKKVYLVLTDIIQLMVKSK